MKKSNENKKENKDYKRRLEPNKRIRITPNNFKEFLKKDEEE